MGEVPAQTGDGMTKLIPLSIPTSTKCHPKYTGLYSAIVDDEDFPLVSKYNWSVIVRGSLRHVQSKINGKNVYLHRIITNAPKGLVVDHIDGNGLNNTRSNLRICTVSQNLMNSRPKLRKNKTSRYKGVYFHKKAGKFAAHVAFSGKTIHLGLFELELEAALAYDKAASKYQGEFAYLNFPQERTNVNA